MTDKPSIMDNQTIQPETFPGKLIEHVGPRLTHSMFIMFYKPSYCDKWRGTYPYESVEQLKKDRSWAWKNGDEIRIYEIQLPTGANPITE